MLFGLFVRLLSSNQKYESGVQRRGPGWEDKLGVTGTQVMFKAMSLSTFLKFLIIKRAEANMTRLTANSGWQVECSLYFLVCLNFSLIKNVINK